MLWLFPITRGTVSCYTPCLTLSPFFLAVEMRGRVALFLFTLFDSNTKSRTRCFMTWLLLLPRFSMLHHDNRHYGKKSRDHKRVHILRSWWWWQLLHDSDKKSLRESLFTKSLESPDILWSFTRTWVELFSFWKVNSMGSSVLMLGIWNDERLLTLSCLVNTCLLKCQRQCVKDANLIKDEKLKEALLTHNEKCMHSCHSILRFLTHNVSLCESWMSLLICVCDSFITIWETTKMMMRMSSHNTWKSEFILQYK